MKLLEYEITQTMDRMDASALYHVNWAAKRPGHTITEEISYPGGPVFLVVRNANGKYVASIKKPA